MSGIKLPTVLKVVAGSVCIGGIAVATYKVYKQYFQRDNTDEGFIEGKQGQLSVEKKVLVVGLSGSGKTSVISRIAHLNTGSEMGEPADSKPTEGFSVTSVSKAGITLNIWEIGGSDKVRPYWSNFLLDVDVLVFVIDASNSANIPLAYEELHKIMGDDRLRHVPVLILANKQDVGGAESCESVKHLLALEDIPRQEHDTVQVIGTQIHPYGVDELSHASLHQAEDMLISLCGRSRRR